jgi:hypothetical protein
MDRTRQKTAAMAGLYQSPPVKATLYKVFFMYYSAGPLTLTFGARAEALALASAIGVGSSATSATATILQ